MKKIYLFDKGMTTLLTLAVYSLKVSNDFPTQSIYLPYVSIYFTIGYMHTFLSLLWFAIQAYSLECEKLFCWINAIGCFITRLSDFFFKKANKPSTISAKQVILVTEENSEESNKILMKKNCINCDLCCACSLEKNKETENNKFKKEIKFKCKQVNKIIFSIIFLSTLISYTTIWTIIQFNNF